MANSFDIEWTESTWNPATGCTKVGAGCKHCYAERMAHRLQAMGQANYPRASLLGNNRVVFDIKGNDYRLNVSVADDFGAIFVKFIGTHAQYGKVDAATVEME